MSERDNPLSALGLLNEAALGNQLWKVHQEWLFRQGAFPNIGTFTQQANDCLGDARAVWPLHIPQRACWTMRS
jgi:hypothetical protein